MASLHRPNKEARRERGPRPAPADGQRAAKVHRAETAAAVRNPIEPNDTSAGVALLEWLIGGPTGMTLPDFLSTVLERKPVHVGQRSSNYFSEPPPAVKRHLPNGVAWSSALMRSQVVDKEIMHTTDVNIVRFDPKVQKRLPLKTEGRVSVGEYDKALASGWSVRFLRPQEHSPGLSTLLYLFDEAMSCSTGMNSYWTPRQAQGFAPHYDDVDVFMLQLEGSKRWRVYSPPTAADELPRVSSPDYKPSDLPAPLLDVTLRAGEVLYLPRGWVHQGITSATEHSLHVTVSAFQNHTWADLVKGMLVYKVDQLAKEEVDFRRALPLGWWNVLGGCYNPKTMGPFAVTPSIDVAAASDGVEEGTRLRAECLAAVRRFCERIAKDVATKDGIVDKGADLFAVEVLSRRQPPPARVSASTEGAELELRLVSRNAVRLVIDREEVALHHCGGNNVVCLGPTDVAPVVTFDIGFAPALATLLAACPRWTPVASLPFPDVDAEGDDEASVEVRQALVKALCETRVVEVRSA
jgi:lysine-specific demethylase/histidyl-hydroxylase NO66